MNYGVKSIYHGRTKTDSSTFEKKKQEQYQKKNLKKQIHRQLALRLLGHGHKTH